MRENAGKCRKGRGDYTFADIDFFYVSSFIFKENHVVIEEENPSEKHCRGITRWYI